MYEIYTMGRLIPRSTVATLREATAQRRYWLRQGARSVTVRNLRTDERKHYPARR